MWLKTEDGTDMWNCELCGICECQLYLSPRGILTLKCGGCGMFEKVGTVL